jgi:hypothetical protein
MKPPSQRSSPPPRPHPRLHRHRARRDGSPPSPTPRQLSCFLRSRLQPSGTTTGSPAPREIMRSPSPSPLLRSPVPHPTGSNWPKASAST